MSYHVLLLLNMISVSRSSADRSRFWGIFYVDASTDNNAESGFYATAECCDLKGCDPPRTRRWLSNQKDPWLLILDNADDPAMELPKYFPGGSRGTILITTRNPDLKKLATVGSSEVGRMNVEDAASLLLKASESGDPQSDTSKALATKIVDTLGCLALAIVHAAALIRQRICRLEEYTEIFNKHRQRLLSNSSGRLPRAECDVYATWHVSRAAIQSIGTTTSVIALELLNIFACFHFGGISEQIFHSAWDVKLAHANKSDHRQAVSEEWIDKVLEKLRMYERSATQSWDPLPFREAVSLLSSFSLVSYAKGESGLVLHPLIHAWARDHLGKVAFAQWSTRALVLLNASVSKTRSLNASYRVERQWLAHVNACSPKPGDLQTLNDDDLRARLTADFACCPLYQNHGQIHEALYLASRGVRLAFMRWGNLNTFTLWSTRVLADQFQAMGEFEKALEIYGNITRYVDQMPSKVLFEELMDLQLLEQEAKCHHARERFELAVKCQEAVVKRRISTYGKEIHETLASMALLVALYGDVDRAEDGVNMGEDVFSHSKRLNGDDDIRTLFWAQALAEDYQKIGKFARSLEMLTWQSDTYLSSTVPANAARLCVLHTLVLNFYGIGHKKKARALATILTRSSEETLGLEHPQTRKRLQLVDCLDFWAQVNIEAAEKDEPISSKSLDRLALISTEIIGALEPKTDERIQQQITEVRKELGRQGWVDPKVRASILKWMKVQESLCIVPKLFMERKPQVESTLLVLEGDKSVEARLRESLGPELYAELQREEWEDPEFQDSNAVSEEDEKAEDIGFMSREKISEWLAD